MATILTNEQLSYSSSNGTLFKTGGSWYKIKSDGTLSSFNHNTGESPVISSLTGWKPSHGGFLYRTDGNSDYKYDLNLNNIGVGVATPYSTYFVFNDIKFVLISQNVRIYHLDFLTGEYTQTDIPIPGAGSNSYKLSHTFNIIGDRVILFLYRNYKAGYSNFSYILDYNLTTGTYTFTRQVTTADYEDVGTLVYTGNNWWYYFYPYSYGWRLVNLSSGETTTYNIPPVPRIAYNATIQYNMIDGEMYYLGASPAVKFNLIDYDLTFNFKTNDGTETLATVEHSLPIKTLALEYAGQSVNVTLTLLDGTTSGVSYTPETLQYKRFVGLANAPRKTLPTYRITSSYDVNIDVDTDFYDVFTTYKPVGETFTITLYNSTAEKNRVNKADYLTPYKTVTGALRYETSILSPEIIIENDEVPSCNYAHIDAMGRYYFISDISSVNFHVWRLRLNCDTLMTYNDQIRELNAIVARQENDYDRTLLDNRQIFKSYDGVFYYHNDESVTDIVSFNNIPNAWRYILVANAKAYTPTPYTYTDHYQHSFNTNVKNLLDYDDVVTFSKKLYDVDFSNAFKNFFAGDPVEGILSLTAYPFDLKALWESLGISLTPNPEGLVIGDYQMNVHENYVVSPLTDQHFTFKIGVLNFSDFILDWWNYTDNFTLYLPFYGFIELSPIEVYGKYITILYSIDFDTGIANISVYSSPNVLYQKDMIIKTVSCQIGVGVAFSQSNSLQQIRNLVQFGSNMVLGMVTGGVGLAVAGSQALGALTSMQSHYTRGAFTSGAASSLDEYLQPFVRVERHLAVTPSNYLSLNGKPLELDRLLGDLTGYTEIGKVHIETLGTATSSEIDEVEALLKSGVIL